jgi:hypothetical protein
MMKLGLMVSVGPSLTFYETVRTWALGPGTQRNVTLPSLAWSLQQVRAPVQQFPHLWKDSNLWSLPTPVSIKSWHGSWMTCFDKNRKPLGKQEPSGDQWLGTHTYTHTHTHTHTQEGNTRIFLSEKIWLLLNTESGQGRRYAWGHGLFQGC